MSDEQQALVRVRVVKRVMITHEPRQIGETKDADGKVLAIFETMPAQTVYEPGEYDVTQETADHWYFKAHLEGYQPPPPPIGSDQYAQRALMAEQATRQGEAQAEAVQTPAPALSNATVATPATRFAGKPVEDKDPNRVSFLA
jgi:hypothetical protein